MENTLPAVSVVSRIVDMILDGQTLRDATKAQGISIPTFHKRLSEDKAAALAYARAVEMRADLLADEALTIADNENDAAKARNQIQVRQWLASKLYAKRYGDRIDLNVTQTLDIGSTLAEARARLRPVRDQSDVIDAQAIDVQALAHLQPSDCESVSPAPGTDAVPDIFT